MRINGVGNDMQTVRSGMNMQTDSVSKNIQNQIANAQKQLQELSSNEHMALEEKMKKRQEIQQEISTLNQQLRQHQMEQRKEQQSKATSMDDMLAGNRKMERTGNKESGLSQASMQAIISADTSIKQAKVQGSMVTQMEGKAGVLESEIKMDKGRGASTEKKEEELADLKTKVQVATTSQISILADAKKTVEEAAKADQVAEPVKHENRKSDENAEKNEKANGLTESTADSRVNIENTAVSAEDMVTVETSAAEPVQTIYYTSVDIRL